ncbi:glycosyltransferase [Brevibacterium jeotgali]|uniref:D-inositol 3-phosphate glycosyltransferase n=1 Tax=Brevibacterium jeotgali TaxID=1262550 RepID=A0A2H1L180_9MICO|nr:glycosyltransferase [Brevibacterium jeotgali]TWC01982.1 glycosyltransferase involved in cell wall biosynthesis [Brevibacterium jeotgali]SMY10667.1 Glycosyltransferase involved in cell wall bisynthesis [Brevibacterium jeotgali]
MSAERRTSPERRASSRRRTAYVVKVYPRFSETFIVTEILAREAAGDSLDIFALRPTTDVRFHPELARVKAPVHFVPRPRKMSEGWETIGVATAHLPGFAQRWADLLPELTAYPADDVHQAVWIALELHRRGITHLHGHFGSLAGQTAELAALLAGVTFSVTTHAKDLFHDSVDPDRLRLLLSRAHHTVTISSYNLDHLAQLAPDSADRVHLVYNGLELDRFPYRAPRRVDQTTPLQIVGVGRLVEKKGFADLISAALRLRDGGIPVHVRIAGDGDQREALTDMISEAEADDVVTLLGAVTQVEVVDLLRDADVFASPCVVGADGNADGLPTVLLEAMAIGVPCVASTVTGIPEAVRDEDTGLLHAPGDLDGLVRALTRLADPAFDRAGMARRARSLIEARFDSGRQGRTLMGLEDGVSTDALSAADTASLRARAQASPAEGSAAAPASADAAVAGPVPDLRGRRVAYVCVDPGIPVFGTKGATVHIQEVVRVLRDRGADVTVYAARRGKVEPPSDLADLRVVHVPVGSGGTAQRERAQVDAAQEIAHRVLADGTDLVYERYSLFSDVLARAAVEGVPGVLEVNAPLIDEQREHRELVDADAALTALRSQTSAATRIACVSEPVADWVRTTGGDAVSGSTIVVAPNGVNTRRLLPREEDAEQAPAPARVVFVGTLKPWHGTDVLLSALAESAGDWRLRIVGDGPQGEELRARVAQLPGHTAARVEFTGAVAPEQVPDLLADSDVAVAPYPSAAASDSYFSPLKVYEYLAAGLPVVASAIGQIPQVLDGTGAGILVPPSDAGALGRVLDSLAEDRHARQDMSRRARRLAVERHDWNRVVDAVLTGMETGVLESPITDRVPA